MVGGRVVV